MHLDPKPLNPHMNGLDDREFRHAGRPRKRKQLLSIDLGNYSAKRVQGSPGAFQPSDAASELGYDFVIGTPAQHSCETIPSTASTKGLARKIRPFRAPLSLRSPGQSGEGALPATPLPLHHRRAMSMPGIVKRFSAQAKDHPRFSQPELGRSAMASEFFSLPAHMQLPLISTETIHLPNFGVGTTLEDRLGMHSRETSTTCGRDAHSVQHPSISDSTLGHVYESYSSGFGSSGIGSLCAGISTQLADLTTAPPSRPMSQLYSAQLDSARSSLGQTLISASMFTSCNPTTATEPTSLGNWTLPITEHNRSKSG